MNVAISVWQNFGLLIIASFSEETWAIRCFRCYDAFYPNACSGPQLNTLFLSDCAEVFEAYFCIKTFHSTSADTRNLSTARFCSTRDLGNYCEYIRQPGDDQEYKSCVFTCQTDGCNIATICAAAFSASVLCFSLKLIFFVRDILFA